MEPVHAANSPRTAEHQQTPAWAPAHNHHLAVFTFRLNDDRVIACLMPLLSISSDDLPQKSHLIKSNICATLRHRTAANSLLKGASYLSLKSKWFIELTRFEKKKKAAPFTVFELHKKIKPQPPQPRESNQVKSVSLCINWDDKFSCWSGFVWMPSDTNQRHYRQSFSERK